MLLALGTVVVLGCVEQPSSRVAESPQDTVFDELATVVDKALAAKSIEADRLAQFGVEKQRLVSALMPLDMDWADLHALAVEDYVTERDPEAAKNLCVVLELEFMAAEAVSRRKKPLVLYIERRSEQKDRVEEKDRVENPKTGPRIRNKTFQTAAITPERGDSMAKSSENRTIRLRSRP